MSVTLSEYEDVINQAGQLLSPKRFSRFLELIEDEEVTEDTNASQD